MVNVHGVVDESSHSSRAGFPTELGNLLEHKIRERGECVQHHSKIHRRTFRRNVECERPEIYTTIMDEIGVGQWSSSQVGDGKCCVCADSVLCVGWMENGPRVAERKWKGQVEDLRMYSSHQDAVGIDGEAIEFEWIFPRIFDIVQFSRDPERLGGEEHQTRKLPGPNHLHVNVQCHSLENK